MADFNHFPQIAKALQPAVSRVVRKTAFDIQARAMAGAPVATGFLRNSIYVVTSSKNTYGRGVKKAKLTTNKQGFTSRRRLQNFVKRRERQRKQEAMLFEQITVDPGDTTTAYVAVAATYGLYVEMGTSRMPARPFFYPAFEAARPGFYVALRAVEKDFQDAAR